MLLLPLSQLFSAIFFFYGALHNRRLKAIWRNVCTHVCEYLFFLDDATA
jgi:hypothetical protein